VITLRCIKTLILAGLCCPALASGEGFYAGGALGFAEAEFSQSIFINGNLEGDDTLFLLKGLGGYRVNRGLAFEGSLVGAANDEDGIEEVSFGAIGLSALGIIPATESFELFGKVGYYFGESEVANRGSEDENGFIAGAGTYINLGSRRQFTIRLEYEYYDVDELEDFWSLTGGFQYNFR